jgi:hypothetical protein
MTAMTNDTLIQSSLSRDIWILETLARSTLVLAPMTHDMENVDTWIMDYEEASKTGILQY